MKVKLVLPALTEATSPLFRPIKYSLFPPLGLATLAAYLDPNDDVTLVDEHVEKLNLNDSPDLVVIQVYITSAFRAYRIADHYRRQGAFVALGGLHVTSLPEEAAAHADAIFLGPGEDIWPEFLRDFRAGHPQRRYQSRTRSLIGIPPIRRDLIKRHLYLVPNSIVVSRGCPHVCDFCYKEAFFQGGKSFYTQTVDDALAEIARLPGRHLYFLDDHLFGNRRFAEALFDGMRGMGRVWQAAGTVNTILSPGLLEKAVACGLRSLFVGFETTDETSLREQRKFQNLNRDYGEAVRRLHDQRRNGERQLRLRYGRTRCNRLRSHHRLGDHQRHRDLDLSHPHAVSEHRIAHAYAARGPPPAQQLGSLRHASLRLPPLKADWRCSGSWLLARL